MIINKLDNVDVNLSDGHKYALCDIKKGDNIIKYGNPIGHATEDIKKGNTEITEELVDTINKLMKQVILWILILKV